MARSILIVEDHAIFRATLRRFLESKYAEVRVVEAANGQDAVDCCSAESPDVVVMDVNMPVLDGLIACQQIKKRSPGTSVVLYSSDERPASRTDDCADAFVAKQFVFEQLPGELAALLPQSELD